MLKQEIQQALQQSKNFRWDWADPYKGRKSLLEDCLLQGSPPIGMGRPAGRIVPEGPEVREFFGGVASGPQL